MHLILNPSDIYSLTGVHSHDPGEIMILLKKQGWIIFCDPRTSGLFDAEKYEIIDDRKAWWKTLSQFKTLSTDPDFLTQSLRTKIEWYGPKLVIKKSPIIEKRLIKTSWEIELLRTSQTLNKRVYDMILPFLVPWVTEEAIARRIQILQLELGATGPSFPPIVAFGENSAIPHHSPTERKLQSADIVLIDMGLIWKGYCSDMTRTHLFSGTFDSKSTQNCWKQINSLSSTARNLQTSWRSDSICSQTLDSEIQEIIQLLQDVTNSVISYAKPGMKVSELDKKARKMLGKYEPYFTHSLGHGVGIDIHEAPHVSGKSREILEPGMIITIEPGIYIPGKYGARYEEMCVVDKNGLSVL